MNNLYYNPKRLKKIKNKRKQKTKKVWGWILTVLGGTSFLGTLGSIAAGSFAAGDLVSALIFLIPGILLILSANRKVKEWDRYEAIIDNRGNTPISLIAKKMGVSEKKVYSDLQEMIHSDFFIGPNCNIEAYVDAERDMLVMASGGQPLRPVPDLPEKEEYVQQAAPEESFAEEEPVTGEAIYEEELTDLELIRRAIASTPDDEVRGYLYGLEGSVRRIDDRLQDQPELMQKTSIKRLYKYYLPQIMELIGKYQEPDTSAELRAQIKEALKTSANALSNIEADLLEREQMDAEVDIEVLKKMFAQDGLLGRGGQQGQQGQAGQTQRPGAGQAQPTPQTQPAPQAQPR